MRKSSDGMLITATVMFAVVVWGLASAVIFAVIYGVPITALLQ